MKDMLQDKLSVMAEIGLALASEEGSRASALRALRNRLEAAEVSSRHGSDGEPVEIHPACHPTVARIRAARLSGSL